MARRGKGGPPERWREREDFWLRQPADSLERLLALPVCEQAIQAGCEHFGVNRDGLLKILADIHFDAPVNLIGGKAKRGRKRAPASKLTKTEIALLRAVVKTGCEDLPSAWNCKELARRVYAGYAAD